MFYLSDKKEARSVYIVPEMSYRRWSLLTESGHLCSMKPRDPRVFARIFFFYQSQVQAGCHLLL